MRAIIGNQEFEKDLIELNRELLKHDFSEVSFIEGDFFSFNVKVDLINQEIFINDEKIELNCPKLEDVRWINFRRVRIDFQMTGEKKKTISYGIGFQGELNGNIQRFILIQKEGWTLEDKRWIEDLG